MPGRSTAALVEPDILEWARVEAGLSVPQAAHSLQIKPDKVLAWERGAEAPSMAQLRKMATTYRRLLSDFYLPSPPQADPIPHDFRRLPGEVALLYSRALRYQLRLARQRRELALDLAAELEVEPRPISVRLDLTADPERAGAELRELLGVSLDEQRKWRNPRLSYNGWRAKIEDAGMLVFQVAGIATSEMLGFSLGERPLPVIGVNRGLTPSRRTFTLLHECTHIFLGQSSICDIDEAVPRPPEEQRVEVFCNAVAGAALVPRQALLAESIVASRSPVRSEWDNEALSSLANVFGVSDEVILRRLLTLGRTTQRFYGAWRATRGKLFDSPTTDPELDTEYRRNIPQEVISNLGRPFTRLVVDSYLNSYTSLADVSRHFGLRAEQVAKVRELLAKG